jgi:hypothetical protein
MRTTSFLLDYLDAKALVTIANDKGSILYQGYLGDMPVLTVRNTKLQSIEGLGSLNDIIITVTAE